MLSFAHNVYLCIFRLWKILQCWLLAAVAYLCRIRVDSRVCDGVRVRVCSLVSPSGREWHSHIVESCVFTLAPCSLYVILRGFPIVHCTVLAGVCYINAYSTCEWESVRAFAVCPHCCRYIINIWRRVRMESATVVGRLCHCGVRTNDAQAGTAGRRVHSLYSLIQVRLAIVWTGPNTYFLNWIRFFYCKTTFVLLHYYSSWTILLVAGQVIFVRDEWRETSGTSWNIALRIFMVYKKHCGCYIGQYYWPTIFHI